MPLFLLCAGCASPFEAIDGGLARQARLALRQERPPQFEGDETEEAPEEPPRKSVLVAELLAIFPGFLWHGLGHYYAGDTRTARRIHKAGEWGYLLTAIGGGIVLGGYYLDKETDLQNFAISLYASGGVTGTIGSGFFLTAWFYDMIDTPRAVRSGGEPPPAGSLFGQDLGDFGDEG
jgi:hypothetical protein